MAQEKKKQIVTIGGGTGTFVVLSGLKHLPDVSLTAIVSVADDGGSTGRLRDAYGFLPLGDARQALIALSNGDDPSLMRALFGYRFSKGDLSGHNFGNLFLTALTDILGSDADAIEAASKVLRVKGRVMPVSREPATLIAELKDGTTITTEHEIDERVPGRAPITSLKTAEGVRANDEAVRAIHEADVIVLGPGDLYASTLANFAVEGMPEAVKGSNAHLVYVMNLFTKAGQTEGYSAKRHIEEITQHVGRAPDTVIMHSGIFADEALQKYKEEHELPVTDDLPQDPHIVRGDFADTHAVPKAPGDALPRSLIRHDPKKIASVIQTLL